MDSHTKVCTEWAEFLSLLDKKYIILSPFCGGTGCETKIKEKSTSDETYTADRQGFIPSIINLCNKLAL